ncbi:MAG: T9SS type A sorting domain-containing protein [Flavobacteriales bacterium]|nr:T9SS type A sorting domain-containing protein [Flavobacteriales bacterium]
MKSYLKILFALFAFTLSQTTVSSQVTLEYQGPKIYPNNSWFFQDGNHWTFDAVQISDTERKFVEYELSGSNLTITLYNYDFSIFDNVVINLQLSNGEYVEDLRFLYINRKTFDLDNDLEVYMDIRILDTLASFPFSYTYSTRIYEHNGLLMHDFGDLAWGELIEVDGKALAFFTAEQINDTISNDTTVIYSFPGQLLSSMNNDEHVAQKAALKNFPNPFQNNTTIAFDLPKNIPTANLNVFDQTGKMVKTFKVNNRFGRVLLNTNDFGAGIYYYNLESEGRVLNSKKMIKVK